jgi:hypothetical protein
MTIFNKPLSEYVAFCGPFLILIPLVGIVRLVLSVNGAPNTTVRWVTMTALTFLAVIYYAVRVHTTGFGSYRHLLVICALLNLTTQIVSILGIVTARVNGRENIYSAPEYSFGQGSSLIHIAMHMFIGTTLGSLVPWLFGSLILAATRKFSAPARAQV